MQNKSSRYQRLQLPRFWLRLILRWKRAHEGTNEGTNEGTDEWQRSTRRRVSTRHIPHREYSFGHTGTQRFQLLRPARDQHGVPKRKHCLGRRDLRHLLLEALRGRHEPLRLCSVRHRLQRAVVLLRGVCGRQLRASTCQWYFPSRPRRPRVQRGRVRVLLVGGQRHRRQRPDGKPTVSRSP